MTVYLMQYCLFNLYSKAILHSVGTILTCDNQVIIREIKMRRCLGKLHSAYMTCLSNTGTLQRQYSPHVAQTLLLYCQVHQSSRYSLLHLLQWLLPANNIIEINEVKKKRQKAIKTQLLSLQVTKPCRPMCSK